MNPNLAPFLESLATGNPGIRKTFVLERRITSGAPVPPDTFLWDDQLTLRGDRSTAVSKIRRSVADVSGQPIGEFQISVDQNLVANLAKLMLAAKLDSPRTFRVEPGDTMLKLTLDGKGVNQVNTFGLRDPNALRPVMPLLTRLDELAAQVQRTPIASLELRLNPINPVSKSDASVSISGSLINSGSQGYWITHPNKISQGGADPLSIESLSFTYGRYDPARPGETPLPVTLQHATLQPLVQIDDPLLWVPPHGEVPLRFLAMPRFSSSGNHVCKLSISTYDGEDLLEDKRRLRGAAFSNEIFLDVR